MLLKRGQQLDCSLHHGGVHCAHVTPAGWLASNLQGQLIVGTYLRTTYALVQSKQGQYRTEITPTTSPRKQARNSQTSNFGKQTKKYRSTKSSMCGWWFVEVVCCPAWPQTSLLTGCTVLVLVRLCWQAGDVRTVHTPYVQ